MSAKKPITARDVLKELAASVEHPAVLYLDHQLTPDAAEELRGNVLLNIGRAVGQSMRGDR